jgi:beta-glucanase (GH16 family)
MTSVLAGAVMALGALGLGCSSSDDQKPPWKLTWSDEFDGTSLDSTKWGVEMGANFGTGQLDFDTDRPENITVAGGQLTITARSETFMDKTFTSARISTQGKFETNHGRIEARMKLPKGNGMWPAFWMLGNDFASVGWPACGEIDIMEGRGAAPATVEGSIHGPNGGNYSKSFTGPAPFSDDFHVFAVEWEEGTMAWSVDGNQYETRSKDLVPRNQPWVYEHPFFIILDLAVGGNFGGPPDGSTMFPQTLVVDYVHVSTR